MSRRVVVHIGLPKTGTSYLQAIVWGNRQRLRDAGLLLPGREKRDHLLSSMIVRDDPRVARRGPGADQAWDVLRRETAAWDGDTLISHEFFCSATREQAHRMVADLAPAEVHVVITARDPLGLLASSWQESLKNKGTAPMADYGRGESDDPHAVWDWRALDLGLVLERWGDAVPPERLHVITPAAPGADRAELWRSFAALLEVPADLVDTDEVFGNSAMGVAEAETLRRLNERLHGFDAAYDRGRWIRTFLADDRLVPRAGEKFWPLPDQVDDARRRGERAVAALAERPYDVIGDASRLLVPDELPERRTPDSVTDAEVADVALDLVAQLLGDVRERSPRGRRQRRGAQGASSSPDADSESVSERDKPRRTLFRRPRRP